MPNRIIDHLMKKAFFMQHSGLFESFPQRTKKVLENLPVEWSSADTSGEWMPDWGKGKEDISWKNASLMGKLAGKPITVLIKRDNDRYQYDVLYMNKKHTVANLVDLKDLIDTLNEGGLPRTQVLQSIYDLLQHKKNELAQYVQNHYLPKDLWQFELQKDTSHMYIRFFVFWKDDPEKRSFLLEKLEEYKSYRPETVITYLRVLFKKENIPFNNISIKHSLIDKNNKIGFLITIQ